MKPYIATIGIDLDARRDLLLHISRINPDFYNRFYNGHLKDKVTYSDFERALFEALASIGIVFVIDEGLTIRIDYKTRSGSSIIETFQDYESALQFAIALLNIKQG